MRALIQEPNSTRFRISKENLPVVDEQLIPVPNFSTLVSIDSTHLSVGNLNHNDGTEVFTYTVKFDHFQITQTSNGIETLVVNPTDSLYIESQTEATKQNNENAAPKITSLKAISLGFKFNSKMIFGLPEREDTLMLENTGD